MRKATASAAIKASSISGVTPPINQHTKQAISTRSAIIQPNPTARPATVNPMLITFDLSLLRSVEGEAHCSLGEFEVPDSKLVSPRKSVAKTFRVYHGILSLRDG